MTGAAGLSGGAESACLTLVDWLLLGLDVALIREAMQE